MHVYLGNYLLGCDPAGVIIIETEARINDTSNVKTLAFHGLFFIYFRSFQTISMTQIVKSIDGALGI